MVHWIEGFTQPWFRAGALTAATDRRIIISVVFKVLSFFEIAAVWHIKLPGQRFYPGSAIFRRAGSKNVFGQGRLNIQGSNKSPGPPASLEGTLVVSSATRRELDPIPLVKSRHLNLTRNARCAHVPELLPSGWGHSYKGEAASRFSSRSARAEPQAATQLSRRL
jgi:hypothetical protein